MLFRRRSETRASRGQALVEFALVLPVLALLLVVAIDFGRVFFGWVSLTNAARIGANYAGQHPDLLDTGKENLRTDYGELVVDGVTGCDLQPSTPGTPVDPEDPALDPAFHPPNDRTVDRNDWGDHAVVTLSCKFDLITPLTEALFSDQVAMSAEAIFPIRVGSFTGPTGGGGTPTSPTCTQELIPDLLNRTIAEARAKWVQEGFVEALFLVSTTGASDDWLVNSQTFIPTAAVQDCVDPSGQSVTVTAVTPPPCPSGQAQVPDLIGDLVSDARVEWQNAGFDPAEFRPTAADNSKTVLTQTTNPVTSPPINGCVTTTARVTITYGDPPADPCVVPNMISMTYGEARNAWTAAGFGTTNLTSSGPSNGTVHQQTPTHPGTVSCDVVGDVRLRN